MTLLLGLGVGPWILATTVLPVALLITLSGRALLVEWRSVPAGPPGVWVALRERAAGQGIHRARQAAAIVGVDLRMPGPPFRAELGQRLAA